MKNPRIETATAVRGSAANDDLPPLSHEREKELRKFASDTIKRRTQAHNIAPIRAKLRASAAGHLEAAAGQVRGRERERISDSDYQSFRRSLERAIVELDQQERLADFEHVTAV